MSSKQHIATAALAEQAGITYEEGRAFLKAILDQLKLGREVRLTGFGTFHPSYLKGKTIKTGILEGEQTIEGRTVMRFRQSRVARDYINGKPQDGWLKK
jgi:nucleoid DNA-binding protein